MDALDKAVEDDMASVALPRALWARLLYSAQLGRPMYDQDDAGEETRLAWYLISDQLEVNA